MESAFSPPPEPFAEDDCCAYAIAIMLIRIHGISAGDEALRKVKAMQGRGDRRGAAFWLKTAHAIDAMTAAQDVQA